MNDIYKPPLWPMLLIGVVSLIWVLPLIGIIMTSIRPEGETLKGWWNIEEFTLTLEAWREVWVNYPLWDALWNSIKIAGLSSLGSILLAPMGAYAFAFLNFPGKKVTFLLLVNAFVIPNQILIIPLFTLWRNVGLIDNIFSVIIPFVALSMAWAVFLVRNYLVDFPRSLIDAAHIDGCGHVRTFWSVVLPNALTPMAAVGILQFMWTWNSLMLPMLFLRENIPLPVLLTKIKGTYEPNWDQVAVATIITSVIPLLIFLYFQKYFAAGASNQSGQKG
jgi:ABC-type glycerol-3-phosphate transport system permease component